MLLTTKMLVRSQTLLSSLRNNIFSPEIRPVVQVCEEI